MSLHVPSQMYGCRWLLDNVYPADCTGADSAGVQCFHRFGPMVVCTLYSNALLGRHSGSRDEGGDVCMPKKQHITERTENPTLKRLGKKFTNMVSVG